MEKILVIEDDFRLRKNLMVLLRTEGYKVDSAEDGYKGIQKVSEEFPDLIICDVMMPVMNGFEVLEELQKNSSTADIPFLFLTAKVEMENLRSAMKLGADDYLFKPFEVEELLCVVKTRLRKKKISEQKIVALQEQITAKVPHELRTPLVPILGYAQLIESEDDMESIKDMVKAIRSSGQILHRKIEKLLMYKELCIRNHRRYSYGNEKHITNISQDAVINYLTQLSNELKPFNRLKISIEQYDLRIEEWDLQTMIVELTENALRFSVQGTPVFVKGYISDQNYNIEVEDNGCGLTAREINSITAFNKFGEEKLIDEGMGLGLAIVEQIVKNVDGFFYVKSKPNECTNISVSIPLAVKELYA